MKRDAVRALRGRIIRSELYALDRFAGQTRLGPEDRPYTVTEHLHSVREVREEEPPDDPEAADAHRLRIFFPHTLGQRVTQWERSDDPMTRFSLTDDYDAFGQPRRHTQIACPRGWRGLDDIPTEPYLATQSRIVFATPQPDSAAYIHDRVARVTSFEIDHDEARTVLALKQAADAGAALHVIGQTLHFYDGGAFIGLPNGALGHHGALVRTESLVLREDVLREAYKDDEAAPATEMPPYLEPNGPPPWTPEYPQGFRNRIAELPQLAGYTFHAGDDVHERGYVVTSARNKFDFQVPGSPKPRGLLLTVRDPLGNEPGDRDTTIDYDDFALLPTKVTNPAGLTTDVEEYDYRVMQPRVVTDPNRNRTEYTFTPVGLLQDIFIRGKGITEGDHNRPEHALRV